MTLHLILLIAALIVFLAATVNAKISINLVALGLALVTASFIW